MKNIDEKEKKLEDTLQKLRDINVQDNNELNQETDSLIEEIDKWQM